ncbi:MAG: hypothetical protein J07HX64_01543 [halophilic archaeon J07HX64]|nr:MAG: hypothetical protein J07HX64_01543 [halophilic archaeon J07HX64]
MARESGQVRQFDGEVAVDSLTELV